MSLTGFKISMFMNIVLIFMLFFKQKLIPEKKNCQKLIIANEKVEANEANYRPILGFKSYNLQLKQQLSSLINRKAPALDKELVAFVKQVMDKPAPRKQIKMSRKLSKTPQAIQIDQILQKSYGFFIEAGGLDGERSSNTIWFEWVKGWTGLLVEPDPYFYTQLVGKNRASWSINACISPLTHVSELPFSTSLGGLGKLNLNTTNSAHFKVPCYPLETLLAALSVTHVDFFSLDVEGAEEIVLESIPFDKLDISTLAVEYAHGDKKKCLELMQQKGYNMTMDLVMHNTELDLWADDFIFVKKNLT